jgi:hypothetical protein
MNSFTRVSIRLLQDDINAALKTVADKHNLTIGLSGGTRFSPTQVTFSKLIAIPKAPPTLQTSFRDSVSPTAVTKGTDPYDTLESRQYTNLAYTFGLKKEWLGKSFKTFQGTKYTIVGLKPSYRKYPVIAVGPQGGRYKFSADTVRNGIIP